MAKTELLVSGAGIGGLTLALALEHFGIDYLLCEKAEKFLPLGAGIILAPNSTKIYSELNILNDLIDSGNLIREQNIKLYSGSNLSSTFINNYEFPSIGIHRGELHRNLLHRIPKEKILLGKNVQSFKETENNIQVNLKDKSNLICNYLVAADGIHSPIRKTIHPNHKLRYSGYTCWRGVCNFSNPNFNSSEMSESWAWGERFGVVPISDSKVYWFMVKNAPYRSVEMSAYTRETIIDRFSDWHFPIPELTNSTEDISILWNDIIDFKPLKSWGRNNITLLGDAAHAMTPNMGQGAGQSIEDAYTLAYLIHKNGLNASSFRKYESLRIPRTTSISNKSYSFGKLSQTENPLLAFIRNKAMQFSPKWIVKKQLKSLYTWNFE